MIKFIDVTLGLLLVPYMYLLAYAGRIGNNASSMGADALMFFLVVYVLAWWAFRGLNDGEAVK